MLGASRHDAEPAHYERRTDRRMSRELHFAARREDAHARPTTDRFLWKYKGRFGQVQFASYPLHRPGVDLGSVRENRQRIALKGYGGKNVNQIIGQIHAVGASRVVRLGTALPVDARLTERYHGSIVYASLVPTIKI